MLLRKAWFRVFLVSIAILATNGVLLAWPPANLRQEALRSLQAATFPFAICTAISLALLSNYVNGLREAYLLRVRDIRTALEHFYDTHQASRDKDIKRVMDVYIFPLLSFNTGEV